jgi:hypothetical protein
MSPKKIAIIIALVTIGIVSIIVLANDMRCTPPCI